MFKNTYQSGFLSILYSVGSHPLAIWDKSVKNGHIRRITDEDVRSLVIELMGTNVATTYITCPVNPRQTLGIRLPFFVMIIKNMKKYFTFEIQILDDKDMHRRFRVSNFQSTTRVRPFCTTMPICLSPGWNQIQFNLSDFTKRAYGTNYLETTRVQIHANVRVRRIYFSDRLYTEDEMPQEFKLYLPVSGARRMKEKKAEVNEGDKKVEIKVPEGTVVEEVPDKEEIPVPLALHPTPSFETPVHETHPEHEEEEMVAETKLKFEDVVEEHFEVEVEEQRTDVESEFHEYTEDENEEQELE